MIGKIARLVRRFWRDQRGETLPFALIALVVGTLLVSPLLAQVSSSRQVAVTAEEGLKTRYAADAGVEYALWVLAHDESLRETLMMNPGTPQTLSLSDQVNGKDISAQVVCVETRSDTEGGGSGSEQLLSWVIWANSQTRSNTLVITGSGHRVNGDIHSNNKIRITGSGHALYGLVEYVKSISVAGSGHYIEPIPPENPRQGGVGDFPLSWNIEDFQPGGKYAQQAAAEGKYHYYTSDFDFSGTGVEIPEGLYYCEEDVDISGSGLTGHVTIVAQGRITVSGSGLAFTPYVAELSFFSNKSGVTAINISGSGNMGGTCFAPNGQIALSGSGARIDGVFMGDYVKVSGSGAQVGLAPVHIPGGSSEQVLCGIYDIRVTAGDTTITARVSDCGEGWEILSWHVK
ncbi:MAG: hypothetical protein J7M05_05725 [Anaerolineae bacterium]|nr:hypothetical protein [Anaerolineae bacterium]